MFIHKFRVTSPAVRAWCLLVLFSVPLGLLQAAQSSVQASPRLATLVKQALVANPELQAASAAIEAAKARLDGAALPIFNPELEVDYERSDIDTLTAGVSQTIDWHGKRRAREGYLSSQFAAAQAQRQALRERLAGELLAAMADYEASANDAELNRRQVDVLSRFAGLAATRGQAGDLGEFEVELAQLAQVEGEMRAASALSAVAVSQGALMRLTGSGDVSQALPELPPMSLPKRLSVEDYLAQHPLLVSARAQSQVSISAVRRTDLDRRADPTLGVRAGLEDDQSLIGLQLSIPLQVRNTYTAEVDAARSESDLAAQQYFQEERNVRAEIRAAYVRFEHLAQAWKLWEGKGRRSLDTRVRLLEKLWRVGELSTTDYLVQLKQSMDAAAAGTALRSDLWRAWISWLQASGQVTTWLGLGQQGAVQ